jgi:4-aminobutyrate aminotransferase/(S)-3-amino-2-methylpropionate transaminase
MADNASLLARREQAVPRGVASSTAVFADRAENAELWDVEGRRYVDFAGALPCSTPGIAIPR